MMTEKKMYNYTLGKDVISTKVLVSNTHCTMEYFKYNLSLLSYIYGTIKWFQTNKLCVLEGIHF